MPSNSAPQIDPAAELSEARAILREHHKKAGHIDAPRCPTCSVFGDLALCLERAAEARAAAVAGDRGAILGLSDWVMEEVLIRQEQG